MYKIHLKHIQFILNMYNHVTIFTTHGLNHSKPKSTIKSYSKIFAQIRPSSPILRPTCIKIHTTFLKFSLSIYHHVTMISTHGLINRSKYAHKRPNKEVFLLLGLHGFYHAKISDFCLLILAHHSLSKNAFKHAKIYIYHGQTRI